MTKMRPTVLSIAGFDPSAGAGVLADVKTFENIGVYGFAVTTSVTYQNENKFDGVKWVVYKTNQKPNISNYRKSYN
jgi:hydroxymethylpyrimidine/phosphomethylpyrimidine kinase